MDIQDYKIYGNYSYRFYTVNNRIYLNDIALRFINKRFTNITEGYDYSSLGDTVSWVLVSTDEGEYKYFYLFFIKYSNKELKVALFPSKKDVSWSIEYSDDLPNIKEYTLGINLNERYQED